MSSLLRGRWSRRLLGNSIMFPVVGEGVGVTCGCVVDDLAEDLLTGRIPLARTKS